jgi:hypothetical protein
LLLLVEHMAVRQGNTAVQTMVVVVVVAGAANPSAHKAVLQTDLVEALQPMLVVVLAASP